MWNKNIKKETYTVEDLFTVNQELKNNILDNMDFIKEQINDVKYMSNLNAIKCKLNNTLSKVNALIILSESVVNVDKFIEEFSKGNNNETN